MTSRTMKIEAVGRFTLVQTQRLCAAVASRAEALGALSRIKEDWEQAKALRDERTQTLTELVDQYAAAESSGDPVEAREVGHRLVKAHDDLRRAEASFAELDRKKRSYADTEKKLHARIVEMVGEFADGPDLFEDAEKVEIGQAWRQVPIGDVIPVYAKRFAAAGIGTLGELETRWKEGGSLGEIGEDLFRFACARLVVYARRQGFARTLPEPQTHDALIADLDELPADAAAEPGDDEGGDSEVQPEEKTAGKPSKKPGKRVAAPAEIVERDGARWCDRFRVLGDDEFEDEAADAGLDIDWTGLYTTAGDCVRACMADVEKASVRAGDQGWFVMEVESQNAVGFTYSAAVFHPQGSASPIERTGSDEDDGVAAVEEITEEPVQPARKKTGRKGSKKTGKKTGRKGSASA